MTAYVDEVRRWPTRIRCFRNGSAHLTADTLEELHAMAERIGLPPAWFQDRRVPHYDLTPSRREEALDAGAVFVPAKEQARRRIVKGRVEAARRRPAVCAFCAEPAACFGEYESCDGTGAGYACSECCGCGNEDGWCEPVGGTA